MGWTKILLSRFPRLNNLCYNHEVSVRQVFATGFDCLKFRRLLHEETKDTWGQLLYICSNVELNDTRGRVRWILTKSHNFLVKSMYSFLIVIAKNNWVRKTWGGGTTGENTS